MATKAELKKLQDALKKAQDNLARATGTAPIPGFKPAVKMPTPAKQPGQAGFVGPVAPAETQFIFNTQGEPVEVYTTGPKAGTSVETGSVVFQGPAPTRTPTSGTPAGGTGTTTAVTTPSNPLNTGPTVAQVDSIAAIKALLSSYGIGDLGDAVTNAVVKGYSADTIDLIMQDPNSNDPLAVAFQTRFSANKARAAAGKSVLSPGAYLALERQYTETMRSYGVAGLAKKETLSSFISNDVSPTEVADRVGLAVTRVQNADPETKKILAQYYPMLNQTDIVSSFLDPK